MTLKAKIRWGILSTARIGTAKVIPAMQNGKYSEVCAIASRNMAAAESAARELKIPRAYGSYDDLLADPEVDAVYNPLPNHLHVPWTLRALAAGKHVLCEKPIALSAAEAKRLWNESRKYPHLKVMEAFMYRFHPQWITTKELVRTGEIGELKTIHSFFSYHNVDPDNIRNKADLGGGGMMDIGCYCVSLSRYLFEAEPTRVVAHVKNDRVFGTDVLSSGILEFAGGTSSFSCSTQLAPYQRVHICGDKGRIEIEIPFNAPPDVKTRLWLVKGNESKVYEFEPVDQYTLQGDQFSLAILQDRDVPTPLDDAVKNMKVIEAVLESGRTSGWVNC
jgi:predicted dehydrogenase